MSPRLTLALETGGMVLPEAGALSVLLPTPEAGLSALPAERVQIVQPFRPHFDHFARLGFDCVTTAAAAAAATVLFLPRAKALARAQIHAACSRTAGLVIVDGAKTDGIDSLLRECRKRTEVHGPLSKAHGKIFWFDAAETDADTFAGWQAPATQQADGFTTAPGVFSADGVDPASRLLAASLPKKLGRQIADLGAGWGYLAAHILKDPKIEGLDLVEADHTALTCARANITDPRARFHWADATGWAPSGRIDTVVMNPPFHGGRAADPALGRDFIAAAARVLAPSGSLWMVANRHLPYETALTAHFAQVQETAGDTRFKVLQASRPSRTRR
jgi:16S rRNA (guanine1207-N2)-methyltransferase